MEATPVMTEGPVGSEWAALPWIWWGGRVLLKMNSKEGKVLIQGKS